MANNQSGTMLRDFVYLDTERLKSILAQVEEGVLEEMSETSGSSKSIDAGVEASVPLLAKLGGAGRYVVESQQTATRTLHDHIYNYVESRLEERDELLILNDALNQNDWLDDNERMAISPTAFALVRGSVVINDYERMKDFVVNFNKIAGAVGRLPNYTKARQMPNQKGKALLENASKQLQQPKAQMDDLDIVLRAFVRVGTVVRIMPFANQPEARVCADLDNPLALRMPLDSLIYRFGSAPRAQWTLFGQLASVPLSTDKPFEFVGSLGAELERAIQGMFNAMRNLEPLIGSVAYPEISMIPIALYRS